MDDDNVPALATAKPCGNHICGKEDCGPVCISCPLCRGTAYCSEACRYIDWATHACPNATHVEASTPVTAFVPYYGETLATPEELAKLSPSAPPFQAHAVTTRLPNEQLVQTYVPPLVVQAAVDGNKFKRQLVANPTGRGLPPKTEAYDLTDMAYTVTVWSSVSATNTSRADGKVTITGVIGQDAVWSGSKEPRIQKLLGVADWFAGKGSKLDIWPQHSNFARGEKRFPLSGTLSVQIETADGHQMLLTGTYDLRSAARQHNAVGGAKKWLQPRLRKKFANSLSGGVAEMFPLVANGYGLTIYLIFHIGKGEEGAQLRDVELLIPPIRLYGDVQEEMIGDAITSIHCDPRSLEDCTALAMGLELRATKAKLAGTPVDADLDNASGIIRRHARNLMEGKVIAVDDEVPMEVNTAIYTALASL